MRRLRMLVAVVFVGAFLVPFPAKGGGGCRVDGGSELSAGRGSKGLTVPIEECAFTPTVL